MRGRKPIPTVLHEIKGTFNSTRHGRDRSGEPIARGDLDAAPPEWLSEDQKASWCYAIEHAPAGLLKQIDRGALVVWVVAEDQHRIASMMQAKIDAGSALPLLTKDKAGLAIASPYLAITNRTAARMLKAGSELGFSPAARPRLAAGSQQGAADESPWDKFSVIDGGKETA